MKLIARRAQQERPALPEDTNDETVIASWLDGRPKSTQETYEVDVTMLRTYIQKPLQHITLFDLQNYVHYLEEDHAPASVARKVYAAKSLLSFAFEIGYCFFNVGKSIKPPKVQAHLAERIVSETAIQKILALETDPRNHAMLRLLYNSGVRVSEVVSLAWKDVQARETHGGQIYVIGKGGKERYILISQETYQEVLALRKAGDTEDSPVFHSRSRGGFLNRSQVNRIVKAAAARAGVTEKMSPHWYRHAHASHAIQRGAPVTLVRDTLGHASIAVTNKYSHAFPDDSSGRFLAV
jgi:integrase/recombinase XerD